MFRREVTDRHALPVTLWASEPVPEHGPEPDADQLAADRAWLSGRRETGRATLAG
ncbi:hypothetical protein ABGB08_39355 [Acrocarpospora sp. B8E8]